MGLNRACTKKVEGMCRSAWLLLESGIIEQHVAVAIPCPQQSEL
jgi:hypothetical protein